jgi:hypothetical protein
MGGITRVHGGLLSPKNFAGVALKDFTLTFWVGDAQALATDNPSGQSVAAGALDQIFRTATGNVGTVSRVGTLNTATQTLRFAIETLGDDAYSTSTLGFGSSEDVALSYATTALALQGYIQALGTVTDSTGAVVHLSSATVAAFAY